MLHEWKLQPRHGCPPPLKPKLTFLNQLQNSEVRLSAKGQGTTGNTLASFVG